MCPNITVIVASQNITVDLTPFQFFPSRSADPIDSMYAIYAYIGVVCVVDVGIYIHEVYGDWNPLFQQKRGKHFSQLPEASVSSFRY